MWQMGGAGPMFGQLGFFYRMGGKDIEDKRPLERYAGESKRLLSVLDGRLKDREFIMGDDYSIADIALWPWVSVLGGFYDAGELLDLPSFPNVERWLAASKARPASEIAQKCHPHRRAACGEHGLNRSTARNKSPAPLVSAGEIRLVGEGRHLIPPVAENGARRARRAPFVSPRFSSGVRRRRRSLK